MRFAGVAGLVVLAGSVASSVMGQQAPSAPVAAATSCTGPFTQVASPSPGSSDNILFGTAASGTDNMWAVGRQFDGSIYRNLTLLDSGNGWSRIPSPSPGPPLPGGNVGYNALDAVSTSGPSDAWAAGAYVDANLSTLPEAMHWDGSSWTLMPLPALPGNFDSDNGAGIVDISPTDVWLVGAYYTSGPDTSFAAHWDGTAWSLVSPPGAVALSAASASGPDDVWAIGVGPGPSFPAMIEHYDGSAWTTSATLPGIRLSGVTSISPSQAWAVGTGPNGPATVEWNGSSWNIVPSPNPHNDASLRAVSGVAGGGVWAVGSYTDFSSGVGYGQPMAMHWDGTAWAAVPAGGFTGSLFGVVAVTPSRIVVVSSGQAKSLVAQLCAFRVQDGGFTPSSAKVSGPGAAAYWVFPASDTSGHELVDGSGFGLFDSGLKAPGASYAFAFPASGTWLVTDRSNGARENVAVPILTVPGRSGLPALWFAAAPPPTGARFAIQDIPPGGTKFVRFASTTKLTWKLSQTLPAGTYKFRSRLRNATSGAATGWSPTLTLTLP